MNIIPSEQPFEAVARFQSLQSGQYWRAQRSIVEQGIDEGTVLLIQSIRWVDNAPHTIILRPHPLKLGQSVYLQIPQEDGTTRRTYFTFNEHRFLLADFLSDFAFEPDHQRIRSDEVRQVQEQINVLQNELLQTQSNPALLASVVEAGLRQHQEASSNGLGSEAANGALLPMATPGAQLDVAGIAHGTVANAIGSGITSEGIEQFKAAAEREHQIATIKAQWIQDKTKQIADTVQQITPFYAEQAAAALAQTEDVRAYVSKLLKGIETLDLYVGKDVHVQTIRQGHGAAKDVPLTFVQQKLLMDEELAVWTDIDQWFDFSNIDLFFDALRRHDGLVEQIFPTPRCVLVMATTRRFIDYGDKWTSMERNRENAKVFLLVRDGMNIHRVLSPVESHLGAARLFPTVDDQAQIFKGIDGSQIKFEDVAYTDKLEKHEEFALHYKRFLLLACGLDHRLKLFGDFYEGPASMAFVTLQFQQQHCRFLSNDDHSILLPGEERPSVSQWIAQQNAYMRSGSRVLCNWPELMNPMTAPGACKESYDTSSRISFERTYTAKSNTDLVIAYKDRNSLCVDVQVSGYSYSKHQERTFTCKVNLSKFAESRWNYHELPFLCLDAVEPDDLRWYINHRASRSRHLSYLKFFKKALKHVESERLSERGTRKLMELALEEGNIAAPAQRAAIVNTAVIAWRAAHRGRQLPNFQSEPAPAAWKALLDQMYTLAGENQTRVAEVESFVRESGREPLRLVMSGGAKLVVYAAPRDDERDDRLEPHAWVHRITIEPGKTKLREKSRSWVLLSKLTASETTLHEWAGAEGWVRDCAAFTSVEHKSRVIEFASKFHEHIALFTQPMSMDEHKHQMEKWNGIRSRIQNSLVQNPGLAIPFGLVYNHRWNMLRYLCVGVSSAHGPLAKFAPDNESMGSLRAAFIKNYAHREIALRNFNADMAAIEWDLVNVPVALASSRHGLYIHDGVDISAERLRAKTTSPLLADWFEAWKASNNDDLQVWLADGVLDANGRLCVDQLLGIELPQDYEPVWLRSVELVGDSAPVKYRHWIELYPDAKSAAQGIGTTNTEADKELKRIVDSVAPNAGYRSSASLFTTRRQAREAVARLAGEGRTTVAAAQLADALQPPAGHERWYVTEAS